MTRISRIFIGGVLLLASALGLAQSSTPNIDPAALSAALDAFGRLDAGYRFDAATDYVVTFSTADGVETITYGQSELSGEMNAAGDYRIGGVQTGRSSLEADALEQSYDWQIASVGGVDYFYLSDSMKAVYGMFAFAELETGWWETNRLVEAMGENTSAAQIRALTTAQLPTDQFIEPNVILSAAWSVDEQREIDGMPVRIVALDADGVDIASRSATGSGLMSPADFLTYAKILAVGTFELRYRLWFGEEDGLLHRIQGESLQIMPYLTAGDEGDLLPPYDWKMSSSYVFDIHDHGAVGEIAAPETAG